MLLPKKIRDFVAKENYVVDKVGMSGSTVFLYGDKVLKVQDNGAEAQNEYRMMRYLSGKLPVPEIYAHEISDGKSYLLMGKCAGEMACSHAYMQNPSVLCKLLADGLKMLWETDISDCPCRQGLAQKLVQAQYQVKNHLVDLENVDPGTFGENGFRDPAELLKWLYQNMPEEELVLSHGDYCLPNLFGVQDKVTGFIDLGKSGIADKWCDIALCYRSLSHNYGGKYLGEKDCAYPESDAMDLFGELGIEPDWKKIRYYILLDELF